MHILYTHKYRCDIQLILVFRCNSDCKYRCVQYFHYDMLWHIHWSIFTSLQSCELMELCCLCVCGSVFLSVFLCVDKSQKFSWSLCSELSTLCVIFVSYYRHSHRYIFSLIDKSYLLKLVIFWEWNGGRGGNADDKDDKVWQGEGDHKWCFNDWHTFR